MPLALASLLFGFASCQKGENTVSGTIEVDEVHVGPRSGGRVEKIFAWEGDKLHAGQPIVKLEATELLARRDLAAAQIDTAIHDARCTGGSTRISAGRCEAAAGSVETQSRFA